ncbi:MAG: META domain-containing protein [Mucispirillum sp.]|nr:META domain-containing protein [Mucispirillum sp.]
MKKIILSAVLLSFFILGCKADNMEELLNKQEYKLAANPKITIGFDNGSVFGSSGVNRYTGSYTIKDGSITFGNMGSTMMMGSEEDMDNETKYLNSLKENMIIKFDNNNNLIIGKYLFIPQAE